MSTGEKSARGAALDALEEVLGAGHSLSAALPAALAELSSRSERAFAQELAYGVLRYLPRLDAAMARLLHRPLPATQPRARAAVLIGLYQLAYLRTPAHAAVGETVGALPESMGWATGMVNAVLRRFARESHAILEAVDREPAARLAHPQWLVAALSRDWPADIESIAAANNTHPPMTLRVNRRRTSREVYRRRLAAAAVAAEPHPHAPDALVLPNPLPVERLPGFSDGECSVQDAAAQLAVPLLAVPAGARVLDACSAPGGKTAHLLEHEPAPGRLTSIDLSAERLASVESNLERLGLRAELRSADLTDRAAWWDGTPYERILLDAPCTATGVIRRHPDIKALRRAEDVERLARRQRELLEALWPTLARDGMLLYATCSVFPSENSGQVKHFLSRHRDAHAVALEVSWGRPMPVGRQILPGEDGMDGFYYALVRKL